MQYFMETGKWWLEKEIGYACSVYQSGLLKIDFVSNTVDYIGKLPDGTGLGLMYDGCIKYKEKLWCMPSFRSKNICIYNLKDNSCRELIIDEQISVEGLKIFDYVIVDNAIYMVSSITNTIYGFDLNLEQCIYNIKLPDNHSLGKSISYRNSCLYVPCLNSKCVFQIDLNTKNKTIIDMDSIDDSLGIMLYNRDRIYFSGEKRCIYVRDDIKSNLSMIRFPSEFSYREYSDNTTRYIFSEAVCVDGECWFIPYQSKQLLYTNDDGKELQVVNLTQGIPDLITKEKGMWGIDYRVLYVRNDRYLGLFCMMEGVVIEIDIETKKAYKKNFVISDSIKDMYSKHILNEGDGFERQLFWDMIVRSKR